MSHSQISRALYCLQLIVTSHKFSKRATYDYCIANTQTKTYRMIETHAILLLHYRILFLHFVIFTLCYIIVPPLLKLSVMKTCHHH